MTRSFLFAATTILAGMLLLPADAAARFVMLDTTFDDKPVGQPLLRRGAEYGEPVPGLNDHGCELVVFDAPGDPSVRISDGAADPALPCHLTWAMRDGRVVTDGRLTMACELMAETLDAYEIHVTDETGGILFLQLQFTPTGEIVWSDIDSTAGTTIGTYAPGQVLSLVLVFRQNQSIYDLELDGVPILTGESTGITSPRIARLVVGTASDADADGAIRFDHPQFDWRPGPTPNLLAADFDDQPVDQIIGTGGAALGQPIAFNSCQPMVLAGVLPTNALEIQDESDFSSSSCRFEFLGDAEIVDQPVSFSALILPDGAGTYNLLFREQGGSAHEVLGILIYSAGTIAVIDGEGHALGAGSYTPGSPFRLEVAFDMEDRVYSLWVDGERTRHLAALDGDGERGLGRVIASIGSDADLIGRLLVDDIRVQAWNLSTVSVEPNGATPGVGAILLGAAPNPFNPRTEIRYAMPATGRARLDILDLRGRLVTRLVDSERTAGEHRAVWDGRNHDGVRVASGAYRIRLTARGATSTASITLIQ